MQKGEDAGSCLRVPPFSAAPDFRKRPRVQDQSGVIRAKKSPGVKPTGFSS
jgi:hypothetical protein